MADGLPRPAEDSLIAVRDRLFLAALALLPWRYFPPFPWLHSHAQWSDALIALATVFWLAGLVRARRLPRLTAAHFAMGSYLAWTALSCAAHRCEPNFGLWKLLGIVELVALGVITSDVAASPGLLDRLQRVVGITTLVTAAAAVCGVALHLAGFANPLIGTFGDLLPGGYARARAGFDHPNGLASYLLFAWGVTSLRGKAVTDRTRAVILLASGVAISLTLSRGMLALVVVVLIGRASTRRRRLGAGIGALTIFVVLAALSVLKVSINPLRPWEAGINAPPATRWEALTTSLSTAMTRPFFGSGPGTLPGRVRGHAFDAHCTPVNVAATLGLPALLAFLAIWGVLWRQRSRPANRAIWGALAGMALDGLTQDIEDFRHLWILFGLAGVCTEKGKGALVDASRSDPR
jgi:hypothetical protein